MIAKAIANKEATALPQSPYESLLDILRPVNAFEPVSPYASILKTLAAKPKIFVSYHHDGDRWYYEQFSRLFADTYDVCYDNSVNRVIDSDNADYVIRTIREDHLTGTSCTIVLCGSQTPWRKFVDWEIKATLDKEHGLIGVNLPTSLRDQQGRVYKPDRLQDNIDSRYAIWVEWSDIATGGSSVLKAYMHLARLSPIDRIRNSQTLRQRNG